MTTASGADTDTGSEGGADALSALREEAACCTRCALYRNATQTVFGEGGVGAQLMLVGEQPGDREDLAGKPFVGPAGRALDEALEAAGVARETTYVTNAVKHFKNVPRGKRRLHKRPGAGEIEACRFWLDRELALVDPRVVVAMGATAVRALAGRPLPVMKNRGPIIFGRRPGFVTIHPSFLLRIRDRVDRRRAFERFAEDLRRAHAMVAGRRVA